jgi:hypothetical protein
MTVPDVLGHGMPSTFIEAPTRTAGGMQHVVVETPSKWLLRNEGRRINVSQHLQLNKSVLEKTCRTSSSLAETVHSEERRNALCAVMTA